LPHRNVPRKIVAQQAATDRAPEALDLAEELLDGEELLAGILERPLPWTAKRLRWVLDRGWAGCPGDRVERLGPGRAGRRTPGPGR